MLPVTKQPIPGPASCGGDSLGFPQRKSFHELLKPTSGLLPGNSVPGSLVSTARKMKHQKDI